MKATAVEVSIIGFCKVLVVCACMVVLNDHAIAGEENMKVFRSYLSEMGSRLDCYFTVESVGLAGSLNNSILDAVVNADSKGVQNIDAMMAFLTNNVSITWKDAGKTNTIHLVADKIERNKTIIRIRDARLSDVIGYALTKKVSVEYDGTPDGLLKLLSVRDRLIQPQLVFPIGMGAIQVNDQTPIRVDVTDISIRDLLTECIPLSGYSRIIWSSYTDGKAKSPVVTVKFYGRSQK